MKKIFLLFACFLFSVLLNAQSLYFVRAIADPEYTFYENPPVQIISYNPKQDTVLQVYKDYTKILNSKFKPFRSAIYYPKYEMFVFSIGSSPREFFLLKTNQPDTLFEMRFHCPLNYDSPLDINIINGHLAYECYNHNASNKKDIFLFKGLNFSLDNYFNLNPIDYKDLYLTGEIKQRVELRPNEKKMYLPIVADIENRPPFSIHLPEKYWVDKETYAIVAINDDFQTLILLKNFQTLILLKRYDPEKDKDYGHCQGVLYQKQKNKWIDLELKGNSSHIMMYGTWLAGMVQDASNWDAKYIASKKISPGKNDRDSVYFPGVSFPEWTFDSWMVDHGIYRPGILFLFNTDTEKYIEWDTKQGDSEILLVHNEIVYYRVLDKIFKATIVKGEKLGKPKLVVRDSKIVPYIHWAFLR